jgi:hypothetical protein
MEIVLLAHNLPSEEAELVKESMNLVTRSREAISAFDVGAS